MSSTPEPSNGDHQPNVRETVKEMPELSQTPVDSQKVLSSMPQQIGRYKILSELGRGGQGVVYRGLHPDLSIDLAIKVVYFSDSVLATRLLREEAKVLCELDHPNIARVRDLEVGTDSEGRNCVILVLDYIRGRTLMDLVHADQVPLDQGCKWLSEVARALDHAHRRGILHLDLKPQNIVFDETDRPKIIDFGLARLRSVWSSEVDSDGYGGTPGFMSPEQANEDGANINARSDIFSLGAILYVLLTRQPPIAKGKSWWMQGLAEKGTFDRQSLDRCNAPPDLKELCLKSMSKDPSDRHATAVAFADDIDAFLMRNKEANENRHDESDSPNRIDRRLIFGSAGLVAVCLLLGIITYFRSPKEPSPISLMATHIGITEREKNGEIIEIAQFERPLFEDRQTEEDDRIVLSSTFDKPMYCFLIRLSPDGELKCEFPESKTKAQSEPVDSFQFPDQDEQFAFAYGPGAYGFILVTSPSPLPPFDQWKSPLKELSWNADSIAGAWQYQSGEIKPTYFGTSRAVRPRIEPEPITGILHQVNQEDGFEVQGVFFEVREKY